MFVGCDDRRSLELALASSRRSDKRGNQSVRRRLITHVWQPMHLAKRLGGVPFKNLDHASEVSAVAFSPPGDRFCNRDKCKRRRAGADMEQQKQRAAFNPLEQAEPVSVLAFSPDGKKLLIVTDKVAILRDVETGQRVSVRMDHSEKINAVAFGADGKMIVTGSSDRTARLWNLPFGARHSAHIPARRAGESFRGSFKPRSTIYRNRNTSRHGLALGHTQSKTGKRTVGAQWTCSGRCLSSQWSMIATGSDDRLVRFWDPRSGATMGEPLIIPMPYCHWFSIPMAAN